MATNTLIAAAEFGSEFLQAVCDAVNDVFAEFEPWQIILFTVMGCFIFSWVLDFLDSTEMLWDRLKRVVFQLARSLPPVRRKIGEEMRKAKQSFNESFHRLDEGLSVQGTLPPKGKSATALLRMLEVYRDAGSIDWEGGKISGAVYAGGPKFQQYSNMVKEVYGMFAWTNPLHPSIFPGVRRMEADVILMCTDLFNGVANEQVGCMTSGGTESILLACKAYRDRGISRGITSPEMVVPVTAHAAFDKAAEYFGIRMRKIPVDPVTMKVNVGLVKKAINGNTVMLVGSAPQFPHGVIDDIAALSALAQKADVGLHVDCCLGSFVIAFAKACGVELDPFDFRLTGVTSISCDTHKYGFCPKGTSVLLWKSAEWRQFQYSLYPDWPGGIYCTVNITGSRPGALVAATWAGMLYHGMDGYTQNISAILRTTQLFRRAIETDIPELYVIGDPKLSVVAFSSRTFNINNLLQPLMKDRHWELNYLQFPAAIHIAITMVHTAPGVLELLLKDLKASVAECMLDPSKKPEGEAAMYGMAQQLPDRSIVAEIGSLYLDATLA